MFIWKKDYRTLKDEIRELRRENEKYKRKAEPMPKYKVVYTSAGELQITKIEARYWHEFKDSVAFYDDDDATILMVTNIASITKL